MPGKIEMAAAASPTVLEPGTSPAATILGLPVTPLAVVQGPRRAPRNLVGTELLARYEVECTIGEGGMATVYRGRHKVIQKAVAIKVLDDALEWRLDAAERFLQEAQVTSRVVHENVVEVTDFGITADGVVFCVMELLQGESLADVIDAVGPLSLPRAAEIMRQICSALAAAHGHGVIHRDLKPANCFLTPRTSNPDFVKLLDFGIARVAQDEAALPDPQAARPSRTQAGFIIGTPDYMAPEQAREEAFDHRVDIYAAGGLFFELLTGRTPYVGKSAAELLAAHLYLPVPDPGDLVPSLSPAVCKIVRTAMAKRAEDRYPSMVAMAAAIADAIAPQQPEVAVPRGRSHRSMAAVLGVGVLALGGWLVSEPATTSHPAALASVVDALPVVVAALEPEPRRNRGAAPSSSGLPSVTLANPEPTHAPSVVAIAAPPMPPTKKNKQSPSRKRVDSPPEVDVPRSVAAESAADPQPLRARISEVKDPFATDTDHPPVVGPLGQSSVSRDGRAPGVVTLGTNIVD